MTAILWLTNIEICSSSSNYTVRLTWAISTLFGIGRVARRVFDELRFLWHNAISIAAPISMVSGDKWAGCIVSMLGTRVKCYCGEVVHFPSRGCTQAENREVRSYSKMQVWATLALRCGMLEIFCRNKVIYICIQYNPVEYLQWEVRHLLIGKDTRGHDWIKEEREERRIRKQLLKIKLHDRTFRGHVFDCFFARWSG